MAITQADGTTSQRALRLWPAVLIVALQLLARFVVPALVPGAEIFGVFAGLLGGVAIVVWWLFFSQAPWPERLGAVILMIVAVVVTRSLLHESIRNGGMGMAYFMYVIPALSLAFVAWAVLSRYLSGPARLASMVAAIVLACGMWTLLLTEGVNGDGSWEFAWRWGETPEERLLAQSGEVAVPGAASAADQSEISARADWPGFRGKRRDGVIPGVRIRTDWDTSPPVELWRRPIGPGWSSFAVLGDRLYTQEQRGDDEVVSCYRVKDGEPLWRHSDVARFWEPQAGAGPRATPTLSDGRVYTFGATGILNATDALDGSVVWSRDAASDTEREVPGWGFTSSPLVTGDLVIVFTGVLVAYDAATGDPRWRVPGGGFGYSSPHLMTIDGVEQVVLQSGAGAMGLLPMDGTKLWEHSWSGGPIVQPALTRDGDLLITTGGLTGGAGMRRIAVGREADGWSTEELWTSIRMKPNYNDFVVHEGHVYGFDGSILAAMDVENGKRAWKGGRYGNGQLLLLPDQDLLLVLSEKGELVLVEARPDQFTELARFPAIEGKSWNHPALVGDVLLVRNDEEMAAFRLTTAG